MLLLKISLLILSLAGCGFKPVYQINQITREDLQNIYVEPSNNLQITKLRNILYDKFSGSINSKYIVEINDIAFNSQPIAIQKNSFISDYSITINVNYKLKLKDGEVIYSKLLKNNSDYHATNRLFANYVAEEDSFNNNINQISDMILKDLILYFEKSANKI